MRGVARENARVNGFFQWTIFAAGSYRKIPNPFLYETIIYDTHFII